MKEVAVYYRVTKNGIKGKDQPFPSTINAQNDNINFLWAENLTIYGEHPYQPLDEGQNPINDAGKWMIFREAGQVDQAWGTIKEGVNEGVFYNCKVATVNKGFERHVICVYSLCYRDIPDVVEKYNALVEKGLVQPNESIEFKTDAQTEGRQEGNFFYSSDNLPELLLNHLKERLEYLRSKNALSQDELIELQNTVTDLEQHINNERENNTSVGVILQAESVKRAITKAKQLPEQVLNFCQQQINQVKGDYGFDFLDIDEIQQSTLNRIDTKRKKASPHMFFEMEPVQALIETSYKLKSDTPDYLLENLRNKINLLPQDGDFRKALEELEKELSEAVQKQKDNNVPMEQIMRTNAIECVKETLHLVQTVTSNESTKNKMDVIQGYENQCCKKTSIFGNFAKAAAFVAITALGFLLGATIGTLIGMMSGAWTGPGVAASAVLGLTKGAIDGAAIGLAVATAVTGVSLSTVGGYLLFKPESTKVVANKAKELVHQEEENQNNNFNNNH